MKIIIKIKTRDKKNSQKNFMGGGGGNFSGDNLPETICEGHFSGGVFPGLECHYFKGKTSNLYPGELTA